MERELTTVEILGLAIRSEEEAAEFYGNLAKKIPNEVVRVKYEALAKEEVSHRHMLVGLYRKVTGEDAPPRIPGKPLTAEGGGVSFEASSIEELLRMAIEREREACAFYRVLAGKMTDANSRRIIERLADIERGHESMIAVELETYLLDKSWYADKPDIQLVGP